MSRNYPDAELAVATWAKANTTLRAATATVSGRPAMFMGGVPTLGNDPANKQLYGIMPMLVLYRAGGNPENVADVPIDNPRISFSCYALNRAKAWGLATSLISEALAIVGGTAMGTSTVCGGAQVLSVVWLPDPALDLPCVRVDISFALVAR